LKALEAEECQYGSLAWRAVEHRLSSVAAAAPNSLPRARLPLARIEGLNAPSRN
jgi:hypothetical protein